MIAYLLLLWLKLRSWANWSILELTRIVQNLLMERCLMQGASYAPSFRLTRGEDARPAKPLIIQG